MPPAGSPYDFRQGQLPSLLPRARVHPVLAQALATMDGDQPAHGRVALKKVAQKVGMAPGSLSRLFRTVGGMSFQDYRAVVRTQRALRQIWENPYQSLTRSAIESGFGSLRTMEWSFRRFLDTTPLAYREEVRKWFEQG